MPLGVLSQLSPERCTQDVFLYSSMIVVCIYVGTYIHLRFKHAILGTPSYLGCLGQLIVFVNS